MKAKKPKLAPLKQKPGKRYGSYALRDNGVYYLKKSSDGVEAPIRVCDRLEVVGAVRDQESNNWGRLLEFTDIDGVQKRYAAPMVLLAGRSEELRAILYQMGMRFNAGLPAAHFVNYLQEWPVTRRATGVRKTGWFKECFVLADQVLGPGGDDVILQVDAPLIRGIRARGTLDEWREHIWSKCMGNPRAEFAVGAAFAAPLLEAVPSQGSAGFHLVGPSSIGKSALQKVAASIYGNPAQEGHIPAYVQQWRATTNGLEATAAQHNDCLLILDEIGSCDVRHAAQAAYLLANGMGKQRADRRGFAREPQHWRLLFLSSGETDLESYLREARMQVKGGQLVRMIEIPAHGDGDYGVFTHIHGFASPAEFVDALVADTTRYHGTPFFAFIEYVLARREEVFAFVRDSVLQITRALAPSGADGQVRRVAGTFALVAAALAVARMAGVVEITDDDALMAVEECFHAWLVRRGTAGKVERRQVCDAIKDYIETYRLNRFYNLDEPDEADRMIGHEGISGYRRKEGETWHYYLTPPGFQKAVGSIPKDDAIRHLVSAGWLQPDSDGKASRSLRLGSEKRKRYYCFSESLWADSALDEAENQSENLGHL